MPEPSKPFFSLLLQDLTDADEAAAYIVAARAESLEMFRTAIRDVAQAHKMANVAKTSGVTRENLYRAFSEEGNPTLDTLDSVLSAIGLELLVAPKGSAVAMGPSPASFQSRLRKNQRKAAKGGGTMPSMQAAQMALPFAGIAKAAAVNPIEKTKEIVAGTGRASVFTAFRPLFTQLAETEDAISLPFNSIAATASNDYGILVNI